MLDMAAQERVQVYIDGGNFHHLVLKKIGSSENDFAIDDFAKFLANGRVITGKRFYVGTVREQVGNLRSKEMMSRQTKFFNTLHLCGWNICTSKLRTRLEKITIDERVKNFEEIRKKGIFQIEFERTREKGIDVKIATDLIVGALDDQYDVAIVVSSDADLVPAIDWVRYRKSKRIEYVGFSLVGRDPLDITKPLQTMISKSDIQRIFTESDLRRFCKPFHQLAFSQKDKKS